MLRLQSFKFKIIYQTGKYNIADSLSRLCKIENSTSFDKQTESSICSIIGEAVPRAVSILEIVENNRSDRELMDAVESIKNGSWTLTTSIISTGTMYVGQYPSTGYQNRNTRSVKNKSFSIGT